MTEPFLKEEMFWEAFKMAGESLLQILFQPKTILLLILVIILAIVCRMLKK